MNHTIALTGVTGKLGGAVAAQLGDMAHRLRLLVRDPSRAAHLAGHLVTTSYDSPAALDALTGVDLLFMVSAGESPHRVETHRRFIEAARQAGVGHVIYTSFLGAAPDSTFTLARDHWHTEQLLRSSGMGWTFLRDSFYLEFLPQLVGDDGVIRGPAGSGRVGAVSRQDVARVVAAVLRDPQSHRGHTYDLTGPQTLSMAQVAGTITEITGRPTSYVDETVEQAWASRAHFGAQSWQVDAWISTYTAIASGELNVLSDTVAQLTGRTPLSLAEVLRLD